MEKQYMTALAESLEKKNKVLDEIYTLSQQQADILAADKMDLQGFDACVDKKDACIKTLNKLDAGFETLYKNVEQELAANRTTYSAQIRKLQQLIKQITDKSVSIQALEERNRKAVTQMFSKERKELGKGKRSLNAAMTYYRSMSGAAAAGPQFLDQKN
jgi:flagellar biosynthesis/type III secretory pathway chaperone